MASFKNLISNTSAQISSGGTITGDLVINGDLQVDGGGSLSFDEIIEGTQVIDVTSTEALLVRKNGDGGDVFVVDTTNSRVGIGITPIVTAHISGTGELLRLEGANAQLRVDNSTTDTINLNVAGGSDSMKLSTGSTTALTIDSSQNIAMGNGKPFSWGTAGTLNSAIVGNSSTNVLVFYTSGAEKARFNSSGYLGINDTNAEAHLTVSPSTVGTTSLGGRSINYGLNINTASGRSGVTVKPLNNYAIGDDNAGFQWLYPFDDGGNGDFKAFRVSKGSTLEDKFWVQRNGKGYFASSVGIGKSALESTDSNWVSLELGGNGALINHSASGAGKALIVSQNAYMGSNNFNTGMDYMDTDEASCYLQHSGTHTFRVASSGTADASITWTDALTIANDSSATFTQTVDGDAYIALDNVAGAGSSVNETAALRLNLGDGSTIRGGAKITAKKELDYSTGANMDASLMFSVLQNNGYNDAMHLTSAGNLGIGTVSPMGNSDGIVGLEISSGASTGLTLKSTSSSQVYSLWADSSGNLKIQDNTNNKTLMTIDANSVISLSNNDGGNTGNTIFGHTAWQQTANVGADYNTIFGQEAMGSGNIGAAERNTGIGFAVMRSITTGDSNVGAGADALYSITTGSDNIGIGRGSGDALKTGEKNCLIGRNALGSGAFGETGNVAIGHESMANLNEGSIGTADNNIAIGQQSLLGGAFAGNPITVSDCIAIGAFALDATADNPHTGTIAIGRSALGALTSGGSNISIGYESQLYQTDGSNNVSLGFKALRNADNGESFNTVLGTKACEFVNHASSDGNTIVGMQAMVGGTGARSYNVALGFRAMGSSNTQNDVAGDENVFIGAYSGNGTWTGSACDLNTAVGYQSMQGALNGATLNTAVGSTALKSLTEGDSNVAVGASALENNTTARYNTSVGASALQYNTNGEHNVALGLSAGRTDASGSNATSPDQSIAIGSGSQFSSTTPTNQIVIGYGADGLADNSVTLGNSDITDVYMAQDGEARIHCSQIQFPSSQIASSHANRLDDYEEGEHTSVITCGNTGTVTLDGTNNKLSYVKIGSMVTVNGLLSVSSVSSPDGYFTFSVPFTLGDGTGLSKRCSGSVTVYGVSGLDVNQFVVVGIEAEARIRVYAGNATSIVNDSANALVASSAILVSVTYFV